MRLADVIVILIEGFNHFCGDGISIEKLRE